MKLKKILLGVFLGAVSLLSAEIEHIDGGNFAKETKSGLVLVDFYGPWCGPCQRLAPTLDRVAQNMSGKVKIYKVNVDKSKDLMDEHDVKGVPTMILFKNGKEVGRLVGYRDQNAIEDFINSHR